MFVLWEKLDLLLAAIDVTRLAPGMVMVQGYWQVPVACLRKVEMYCRVNHRIMEEKLCNGLNG
ncbi:MAG: hypothetical protein JXA42_17060 [Anaerolineales bacterium]|nr:hypothetical protein [Anaerolineales bacterium]